MPPIDRERATRIRKLFDDVVDLATAERAAFYAGVGDSDRSVVREVEELVLASQAAPAFLERPAAASELEGRIAGPWRIETLLASGGMGDVYRAVRADADLPWRAAVKVLKPGLDGEVVSARFRAERRVLAALNHPNIVVLLDAGTIADGRLYLAMELVDGVPIDRYCAAARLDMRRRIALFLQVCAAVQSAHERLVVHCDLKPSNVLVTRDGVPKLLDFGVSALLEPSPGVGAAADAATPAYASPEQLRGDVVAATTDVWGLGVMLYELTAGRRPFVVAGLSRDESLALLATRPAPLADRDLDAVVMKALEPDPARRYSSVDQLATDLRRLLEHRPVLARPASWVTRATKFVRRNRWPTAAGAVVVVALAFGAAGVYRGMLAAREEARLGWRAHSQAVQVSRFLEDLLGALNARTTDAPAAREALLDDAASKIDRSFADYPETEGRLRMAVAQLYLDAALPDKAAPHARRAVDLIRTHRGFGAADRTRAAELIARATEGAAGPTAGPR
ncbi:MAG TPA: serine/threonine-protein kinase [Planctomycetota bacterium]|nr:serine/threonine-protein kinase [Planctomycetota bacterium]